MSYDDTSFDPSQFDSCTGRVICDKCGKFHGDCFIVENRMNEEALPVIPKDDGTAPPSRNTGSNRKRSGLPYLQEQDGSFDKRITKVVAAGVIDDTQRPGKQLLLLQIAYNGKLFLWSLRPNHPCLHDLSAAWGEDETRWIGKEFYLFLDQNKLTLRNWFRVDVTEEVEPEPAPAPQTTPPARNRR